MIAEVSDAELGRRNPDHALRGLSLSEIGCRRKISKQAVHKRIRCMVAR